MRTYFNQSILAGIGLLSLTREKAETFVDELVKRGELKKEEAKDLAHELVQRGEEDKKAIRNIVSSEIEQLLEKSNFMTKKDLESLNKKIDTLLEQ